MSPQQPLINQESVKRRHRLEDEESGEEIPDLLIAWDRSVLLVFAHWLGVGDANIKPVP